MTGKDFEFDDMREIVDDFLVEADELIESLDNNLVTLEEDTGNLDLLNEIFRAAHTIKGTSGFLGFEQVTSLTHRMEDVLNKLRKAEMVVTHEIMDVLLKSLDNLKVLLENIRNGVSEEIDLTATLARLEKVLGGEVKAAQPVKEPVSTLEVSAKVPEKPVVPDIPHETDKQKSAARAGEKKITGEATIRVDVERLDAMMNLMGELVLGRNTLVQTIGKLSNCDEEIPNQEKVHEATSIINFITTELQLAIMKMRMQPIGKVFRKFPRLVRDLAREMEKDIDLQMFGEDTELDKSVIDEIGDPLMHIVRNSCDHGIESPEDRTRQGKPARGTIKLSASQEGSNILIKIEDDGKGLDVDSIRDKAVERGLISRTEVDRMPNTDVFRFIFEAGFSTAKKITDVSGRGVGMDVVRTNIEKLSGMIELNSEPGRGTTISIKLPLTLAIIQGLLVESDNEVFILPLYSVLETIKTEHSKINYVNQKPVVRVRDEVVPVINLNTLFGRNNRLTLVEKPYIIIVGLAEKKLGINVDRFLGQEEIVIKSLGQFLGSTEGVAGATILGDGRIRLIIDLVGLFNLAQKQNYYSHES